MAILAIIEIPADQGGDAADAAKWAERNQRELPSAPGFLMHADGPTDEQERGRVLNLVGE